MPKPVRVEQGLVAYLKPLLPVSVSTRVPPSRPESFVRLSRVGGEVLSIGQSRVQVLIECWGATETIAWGLTETAWAAVLASSNPDQVAPGVEVMDVGVTEPVNFPDSASQSPRYQFIANLTVNLKE